MGNVERAGRDFARIDDDVISPIVGSGGAGAANPKNMAKVETIIEVDVPGLDAEPGSPAETLACKLARSNRTSAVSYATEAGQFQRAGLPTVVCGPGSIDQAHKPDEFIAISQIEACIGFMQRLAADTAR